VSGWRGAVKARVSASLATHALTVGAIDSLTSGTGRVLAASKPVAWAFGAITLAAFARAILPVFATGRYCAMLVAAAGFWTLAFVLTMVEIERHAGVTTLDAYGGRTGQAAQMLDISVRKIQYMLHEYGTTLQRTTVKPPESS
jgi:hypothetical protein